MNIYIPVSDIMTTNVMSITPSESLTVVRDIFKKNKFHHIPICSRGRLVGIISKSDFLHISHGISLHGNASEENEEIYKKLKARDVMTTKLATISPNDHVAVAMEIFLENLFHSIPVVKEASKQLVGIVTTFDVLKYSMVKEERSASR